MYIYIYFDLPKLGKNRVSPKNPVFQTWHTKNPGLFPKTRFFVKYHETVPGFITTMLFRTKHCVNDEWQIRKTYCKRSDSNPWVPIICMHLGTHLGTKALRASDLWYFGSSHDSCMHFRLFFFRLISGKFQQFWGQSRWPYHGLSRHFPTMPKI